LEPAARRPGRSRLAIRRWGHLEPPLRGLELEDVFSRPGALSDEQARALIRITRSTNSDGELAGWMLVWQFSWAMLGIARQERRLPGSDGPRAAVCTAMAELWRQIRTIDLDTNRASIFYALVTKARRAVIPSVHSITPADRVIRSVTDPAEFHTGELPIPGGADGWLREDRGEADLTDTDWAVVVNQVADSFADDLVDDLGWLRTSRYFPRRRALLRAFVACRAGEARTGEHRSATVIAEMLGVPRAAMKDIQADVNRVLRQHPERYQQALGDAVGTIAV
jgi:hypothetical protein